MSVSLNRLRRMTQANGAGRRVLEDRGLDAESVAGDCSVAGTEVPSPQSEASGAPLARHRDALPCRRSGRDLDGSRSETAPIWFAALMASDCRASASGAGHAVSWVRVSERALYTNFGSEAEVIQPLGVHLQGGHTLAVSWLPGQSEYTLEVYPEWSCLFRA